MSHTIFTKPSYYALLITGILCFIVIVMCFNNFSQLKNQSSEKSITIITLIGILIGIHGLLHLGLEAIYNFNPMENILYMQK